VTNGEDVRTKKRCRDGEDIPDGDEEGVRGIVLMSSSEAILYCGVCTATR